MTSRLRIDDGLDQMAFPAPAEIVNASTVEADGLARHLPDVAKVADWTVVLKHVRAIAPT
jgi:hypothetical protein